MAVFFISLHLIWRLSKFIWKSYGCENNCLSGSSEVIIGVASPEDKVEAVQKIHESSCSASSKDSSRSSVSGQESLTTDTPLSSTPGSPKNSGLSRRQKKNRKREKDEAKPKKSSPTISRNNSEDKSICQSIIQQSRAKKKSSNVCKQYDKLGMADYDLYAYFSSYVLSQEQLRQLGFPQESSLHPGKAYIYRDPEFSQGSSEGVNNENYDDTCDRRLDVNAQPFFPPTNNNNNYSKVRWYESDSDSSGSNRTPERKSSVGDISSISLSATAKEFIPTKPSISASISCPLMTTATSTYYNPNTHLISSNTYSRDSFSSNEKSDVLDGNQLANAKPVEHVCARCNKQFLMLEGEYLEPEDCHYHWGKLRTKANLYTCCGSRGVARGCSTSGAHVWSGLSQSSGIIGPLSGYVKTKHRRSYPSHGNFGIYGIDCEMCYTSAGLELAKVSVVGVDGRLVYESLVRPDNDIIDYNTRYSGISAKDFANGQHKNIKEVQNDLMGFVNAETILVGHGLENDLRALKLIHNTILDTTAVFPHFNGLPFRRSLRSLVSSYLKRDIQISNWGHDSYEDARACVELMLWKTRKDLTSRKVSENLHSAQASTH